MPAEIKEADKTMRFPRPARIIAEICLCIMIFSLAGAIILAIDPAGADQFATNTLFNFFGDNPACKYWLSVIDGHSFSFPMVVSGLPGMIIAAFFTSLLLSFCVRVCKEIFRTFADNLEALPTFIGVIIGCGILTILPRFISGNRELITSIASIVIILIGILIMTHTSFHSFHRPGLGLTLLNLLPDAFAASVVMEYIAAISLVLSGRLKPPIPWILGSALITIVVLILVYIVQRIIDGMLHAADRED